MNYNKISIKNSSNKTDSTDTLKENILTDNPSKDKNTQIIEGFVITPLIKASPTIHYKLNIRNAPKTNGEIIGTLDNGTRVRIVNISEEFYKIEVFGDVGYVAKQFISTAPDGVDYE